MKKQEALHGIAQRAAGKTTQCASTLNYSAFNADHRTISTLLDALVQEFDFVWHGGEDFTAEEANTFDCLFALLANRVRDFQKNTSNKSTEIANIISLAAFLEHDDALWPEILKAVNFIPPSFIDALADVFSSSHVDAKTALRSGHLSEEHSRIVLNEIDRKDWRAVEWTADRLWSGVWQRGIQNSGAALYHLDPARLATEIEKMTALFFCRHLLHPSYPVYSSSADCGS